MIKNLFLVMSAVLTIVTAHAQDKDFWKSTNLTFENLKEFLNQDRCYENEDNFLGCVNAVNFVFSYSDKVLSIGSLGSLSDKGSVVKTVEGLELRKLIRNIPDEGALAYKGYVENRNKEETLSNKAWKNFFKTQKNQVNFDNLIDEAIFSWKPTNLEEVVGTTINTFYRAAFDPHTHILPNEELDAEFNDEAEAAYDGIGAELSVGENKNILISPLDNSPALRAGIHHNDTLVAVDDKKVDSYESGAKLLLGKAGTIVKVVVQRHKRTYEFNVQRGEISTPAIKSQLMVDSAGGTVGYIRIRDFMVQGICKQFYFNAIALRRQKARALILDLRDNPGGLVNEAVCIAGLFAPQKMNLLMTRDPRTNKLLDVYENPIPGPILYNAFKTQLIVLMNGGSASASEIVGGILQDLHFAVIVGEPSFGKGTMQTNEPWTDGPIDIQDKVVFMKTEARFDFPSGRSNQLVGLDPDFLVYQNPEPTVEDKSYVGREKDEFTNPILPNNNPYKRDQKLISHVIHCMDKRNNLITKYQTQVEDSALAPDYQLLFAEEVGFCLPRIPNEDISKSALKIKVDDLSKGLVSKN